MSFPLLGLPRALSTTKGDPHFDGRFGGDGIWLNVWLDGQLQREVVGYDIDAGFIVRAVLTQDGKVQVDPAAQDTILCERVEGVVTVAIKER